MFTRRRDLMGDLANTRLTTAVAVAIAAVIVSLNVFLLYEIMLG
jgi:manganese transport protein